MIFPADNFASSARLPSWSHHAGGGWAGVLLCCLQTLFHLCTLGRQSQNSRTSTVKNADQHPTLSLLVIKFYLCRFTHLQDRMHRKDYKDIIVFKLNLVFILLSMAGIITPSCNTWVPAAPVAATPSSCATMPFAISLDTTIIINISTNISIFRTNIIYFISMVVNKVTKNLLLIKTLLKWAFINSTSATTIFKHPKWTKWMMMYLLIFGGWYTLSHLLYGGMLG